VGFLEEKDCVLIILLHSIELYEMTLNLHRKKDCFISSYLAGIRNSIR
jgi:hypothetical protein